ncbi:hypothetical protein D9M70_554820 [compost metagenome]
MSLARRITSSSEEKRTSGATGPKISSSSSCMPGRMPASTVGSKNCSPSAWPLPPVSTSAPLATASAIRLRTLSTALALISGPTSLPAAVPWPTRSSLTRAVKRSAKRS